MERSRLKILVLLAYAHLLCNKVLVNNVFKCDARNAANHSNNFTNDLSKEKLQQHHSDVEEFNA